MPLTYKHHSIIAGAARSETTDKYIPVVYIGWEIGDKCGNHSIVSRERLFTFEEASQFAYLEAKAWIDRHAAELD
jgi:hypothetical protein